MTRFSAWSVIRNGLSGQMGWGRQWRDPVPKKHYDIVIVGGGLHGLATAYYLAKNHDKKNIAVVEKGWLGGGTPVATPRLSDRIIFCPAIGSSTSTR